MTRHRSSARQRLLDAALQLFSERGFGEATTRQIAELAQVNEVTLFRNFGSKHDLLLTAIANSGLFACDWEALTATLAESSPPEAVIQHYARDRLQTLSQFPELLRSIVGESGHYTVENRQALGRAMAAANRELTHYLKPAMTPNGLTSRLPAPDLANLLDVLIFGYLAIELITEDYGLWPDREVFVQRLASLCLYGALGAPPGAESTLAAGGPGEDQDRVADLPADLVRALLQQAKQHDPQDYAIAYLLLGAGLLPTEIIALERSHSLSNASQHLVQITQGAVRQVPINQWILGKRYGSYTNNPLTQWLKNRHDDHPALFLNAEAQPLTLTDLQAVWQRCIRGLLTPEQQPPQLAQARQTWCVEMLMKGITLEDLSILSGWSVERLEPYARRAREKAALDLAIRLDRKL